MHKDNRQSPFINIGSSLLLVIFLILCLVTFATLSLSSTQSDYSFSVRAAERRTQYYQACNTAEDVLAQIDEILIKTADTSDRSRNWMEDLDFTQMNGEEFSAVESDIVLDIDDASLSYQVPVNEKQALEVKLKLAEGSTGYYQIEKWQLINTGRRTDSQTLQLMPIPEAE